MATIQQLRREEARARALLRQAEKAKQVVPAGFVLAPVEARLVPLRRYRWEQLADLLGVSELAGFVLAASCRAKVVIHGKSCPLWTHTKAWDVSPYRCQPGDWIELEGNGRGSGPLSTAKLFPLVRDHGFQPAARPDLAVPLSMPGKLSNVPGDHSRFAIGGPKLRLLRGLPKERGVESLCNAHEAGSE